VTSNDPDQPTPPAGAVEYPSLEQSPPPPGAHAPVDYPIGAGLPPPIYPPPPPGYPPPAGYAAGPAPYPAYDPYRPMQPPGTNGLAVASLAVSVGSIVLCCGAPAFIGIILGVIGIRQTRQTGQQGYGLALAGIIVGALATAGWVIYILFYVALMASGWQWI
jgi:hypothetical protein